MPIRTSKEYSGNRGAPTQVITGVRHHPDHMDSKDPYIRAHDMKLARQSIAQVGTYKRGSTEMPRVVETDTIADILRKAGIKKGTEDQGTGKGLDQ